MTIALLASESVPLSQVADNLRQNEIRVIYFTLNQELSRGCIGDAVEKVVLISPERGVVDIGERVERVREIIGPRRRLILCALQPGVADRPTLIGCGASVIIQPQSWEAADIATRILGQLILDGDLQPNGVGVLRGATSQMRDLYYNIQKLAPISDHLLILGESGTGKELVAEEVHRLSGRSGMCNPINCAELNPALSGSELFGYKKGAFTGADKDQDGFIAAAGEGTVFLDEIGELDIAVQARLLRVLDGGRVRRVGANHSEPIKARILLATNRNLYVACEEGKFRWDLLHRIDGFILNLPPLRERKADIPLLVNYFVEQYNAERKDNLKVPSEGIDPLFRYDWPGNVRELRNVVRKAAVYADRSCNISSIILRESVRRQSVQASRDHIPFDPAIDTWESVTHRAQSIYFNALLVQTNGNRKEAIKLSGLSRAQFFAILKKIDL